MPDPGSHASALIHMPAIPWKGGGHDNTNQQVVRFVLCQDGPFRGFKLFARILIDYFIGFPYLFQSLVKLPLAFQPLKNPKM